METEMLNWYRIVHLCIYRFILYRCATDSTSESDLTQANGNGKKHKKWRGLKNSTEQNEIYYACDHHEK